MATTEKVTTGLDALKGAAGAVAATPKEANGASAAIDDVELEPAGSAPPRVPTKPATMTVPPPPEAVAQPPQFVTVPATRRAAPRGQGRVVVGIQSPPARPSISIAFQSKEDTLLVYRVAVDGQETLIPREWPRNLLDAVGLTPQGVETFVLRHVVADWGGGDYHVCARLASGQHGGDAYVSIAGEPKTPGASTAMLDGIPPPPNGADPARWAQAFNSMMRGEKQKSIGDALTEIQALRTLEKMGKGDDDSAKKIEEKINDLITRVSAAETRAATPAAQTEGDIDKLIKWQQHFDAKAQHTDPQVQILMEQNRLLREHQDKLEKALAEERARAAEDRARAHEKEMEALKADLAELKRGGQTQLGPLGSLDSLKDNLEKVRALSDEFNPPPSGSGLMDVANQALQHWTPDAIGNMFERKALAEAKLEFAKARAALVRKGSLPAAQATVEAEAAPDAPPLQRFVAEKDRQALIDAVDDDQIKDALGAVIMALYKTGNSDLKAAIQRILVALQKSREDALNAQIDGMIKFIYGADMTVKLRPKIVRFLMANRVEMLKEFGVEDEEEKDDDDEPEEKAPAAPASAPATPTATVTKIPKPSKKKE